jgi:CRP-like cAMP-binding protein
MSTHADFATAIATQMAKRTHELFDMIGDQMVLNVQSRLAKRLLALATSMYGYEPLPEQPRIRITQSDLSKLTGATRQSISVHLLGWQKQGLIRQEYGYIHILDLVGIQRQADVS